MVIRNSLGILMFVNQKRARNHRFCPHGPPETVHHLRWFPQDLRETSIRRNCFGILMYSSQKRTKITHFNPLFWTAESFHHPSRLRWFPIGNPPLGENFRGFNVFNTKIDGSNTKLMILRHFQQFWKKSLTVISVNPDRHFGEPWPPMTPKPMGVLRSGSNKLTLDGEREFTLWKKRPAALCLKNRRTSQPLPHTNYTLNNLPSSQKKQKNLSRTPSKKPATQLQGLHTTTAWSHR